MATGEYRGPGAGWLVQQGRHRAAEDGANPLRHVEAAVVAGGVPGAEGVGEGGGEQREDLAPAEERASQAVGEAVDGERQGHRGEASEHRFGDTELGGEGGHLRGDHQAGGGHHRHHHQHQPEDWGAEHVSGCCAGGVVCRGGGDRGRFQAKRGDQADEGEDGAVLQERHLVADGGQ
jgi:hypothetical protein